MQEQNDFLPILMQKIAQNQNNFMFDNLKIIEGTRIDTTNRVYVEDYSGEEDEKLWRDGKPNPYPLEKDDSSGDGTVLNISSSALPTQNYISMEDGGHGDLPTLAINEMSDFFEISRPTEEYELASKEQLVFAFACPIDVRVVDSEGRVISKDEVQIEGGYYYSDGRENGYKIIEIVDPKEENYKLEIIGNGDGNYDGFVYRIGEEKNIEAETSGTIMENESKVLNIDTSGDEVEIREEPEDTTPPEITISSPEDGKEYKNTGELQLEYTIVEDVSAPENVGTETKFDGNEASQTEVDLPMQRFGRTSFQFQPSMKQGTAQKKQAASRSQPTSIP